MLERNIDVMADDNSVKADVYRHFVTSHVQIW